MKRLTEAQLPVERVLQWLNLRLEASQWESFHQLAEWLASEAVVAGGLGPGESERIWSRHLADSLTFAAGWSTPPARVLDAGAGVGLPGLVLAVVWPDTAVILLDRSGKRVDLANRAVRTLRFDNVAVRQGSIEDEPPTWEAAVFRAVLPWKQALEAADRVLNDPGTAVIGLRGSDATAMTDWPTRPVRRLDVPAEVLDGPAALLIMGPREP